MVDLNEKYYSIAKKRRSIAEQLNELSDDYTVKKYFELKSECEKLESEENDLFRQIQYKKYSTCKHILVTTAYDYDRCEGRSYKYNGCIKCGLDQKVLYLIDKYYDKNILSQEQQLMSDYFDNINNFKGLCTGMSCDLELATAIYNKIIETHPNINDMTAVRYLNAALFNIKTKPVNDSRRENRAKRLLLKSNYNKWDNINLAKK